MHAAQFQTTWIIMTAAAAVMIAVAAHPMDLIASGTVILPIMLRRVIISITTAMTGTATPPSRAHV